MITEVQQRILEMPFPLSAHGIVPGVNEPYLRKDAIRTRFNAVDREWSTLAPKYEQTVDGAVFYVGGLVVCGVARFGLGAAALQTLEPKWDDKKKEMVDPKPFEIARMTANTHKKAASDVLARAALEFGVGSYLRRKPKDCKSLEKLAEYLATLAPHWSTGRGGERVRALIAQYELPPELIGTQIEPWRTVSGLADTWLTEEQFTERLHELKRIYDEAQAA